MNRLKDIYDPYGLRSLGKIDEFGRIKDDWGRDTDLKVDLFGNVVDKLLDKPTGYHIDALGCLRKSSDFFRKIS